MATLSLVELKQRENNLLSDLRRVRTSLWEKNQQMEELKQQDKDLTSRVMVLRELIKGLANLEEIERLNQKKRELEEKDTSKNDAEITQAGAGERSEEDSAPIVPENEKPGTGALEPPEGNPEDKPQ